MYVVRKARWSRPGPVNESIRIDLSICFCQVIYACWSDQDLEHPGHMHVGAIRTWSTLNIYTEARKARCSRPGAVS
jgi:hypothetical protein